MKLSQYGFCQGQPGSISIVPVLRIYELSEKYPRFGYRKIFWQLKAEEVKVGRERAGLIRIKSRC